MTTRYNFKAFNWIADNSVKKIIANLYAFTDGKISRREYLDNCVVNGTMTIDEVEAEKLQYKKNNDNIDDYCSETNFRY